MVNSLFLATVLRIGLVVISYGCKVPAGIFVPSMAIGATFGRMVGIMVKAINRYQRSSARSKEYHSPLSTLEHIPSLVCLLCVSLTYLHHAWDACASRRRCCVEVCCFILLRSYCDENSQ